MNLLKQVVPFFFFLTLLGACSGDEATNETVFNLIGGGTSCSGGPILFDVYVRPNGESPTRVTLELAGPETEIQELHSVTMNSPENSDERWFISLSEVQSPNAVVPNESTVFGCSSEKYWKFTAYDAAGNWNCHISSEQESPFADDC